MSSNLKRQRPEANEPDSQGQKKNQDFLLLSLKLYKKLIFLEIYFGLTIEIFLKISILLF